MDFVVIPCFDGFPKFSLASSEVGTIIWSDLFDLAPSRYKSSSCHQKRIRFQAVYDLYMYRTDN